MTPTPYYSDDTVQLFHGDCRDILPALGIEPDLVIADPPYNETSLEWDRWPDGWPGVVADYASSLWCFGSMRMFLDRRAEFDAWNLSQDIVWRKQNGTGFAADRFRRLHEHVVHWYRGGWNLVHHDTPRVVTGVREPGRTVAQGKGHARHLGKIDKGAWVDDGTRLMPSVIEAANMWRRGAIHETEKPVALLLPLLQYGCPPGGLVVDVFAGSCSTGVAARLLGLRAVLIEREEAMCEKAVEQRLQQDVLPLDVGA